MAVYGWRSERVIDPRLKLIPSVGKETEKLFGR